MKLFPDKIPVYRMHVDSDEFWGFAYLKDGKAVFEEARSEGEINPNLGAITVTAKDVSIFNSDENYQGAMYLITREEGETNPSVFIYDNKCCTAMERLESILKTARAINISCFPVHMLIPMHGFDAVPGSYVGLPITDNTPEDFYRPFGYLEWEEVDKKAFEIGDELFDVQNNSGTGDGRLKGTYSYKGQELFELFSLDRGELCRKAGIYRHLAMAYSKLNNDECLGVEVENNNYTLLAASFVDGELSIRRIEDFEACELLTANIERAPYFIIENGKFSGVSHNGKYSYGEQIVIRSKEDLFEAFLSWAERTDTSLFGLPEHHRAKINEIFGGDRDADRSI